MTFEKTVTSLVFAFLVVVLGGRGSLTLAGRLAAFVVGSITFAAFGLTGAGVLLAFFVSSVALSRLGRARKRELVDTGKHGPRDAWQVLANGGVATACALAFMRTGDVRYTFAFAGAYAAANADTWGTEIGTLLRGAPRSILTLRPIAPGMSGGITVAGTAAEVAGAVWIGVVFAALRALETIVQFRMYGLSPSFAWYIAAAPSGQTGLVFWVVPLAGIVGAFADSLLGASLQELRRCDTCGRTCETNPHVCAAPTRLVRGVRGFSNDVVNLLATATGAAVAFALA